MWWSNHPTARSSGMLRAISAGPVYLSDRIGESDLSKHGYSCKQVKHGVFCVDMLNNLCYRIDGIKILSYNI
ncbi:MAG: hypothetical protein IJ365_04660 [Clostridia bacterium]|nr:hypothetical protein [Clostridia bacterium]